MKECKLKNSKRIREIEERMSMFYTNETNTRIKEIISENTSLQKKLKELTEGQKWIKK